MTHDEVVRGLQALVEEIDRETDKLRVLIRQGASLREHLLSQIAAIRHAADPRNDP
jgi:primosomal protein N''